MGSFKNSVSGLIVANKSIRWISDQRE